MKKKLIKYLVLAILKIRWAYFHLNPMYVKFFVDESRKEAHFQHRKTGHIHSNYVWKD